MALPTPGVTPANWGAQLNGEIAAPRVMSKAGAYVTAPGYGTGIGARPSGDAQASRWLIGSPASFDQACIEVTTAATAGGVIRLGVYADSNGYPGALVADWGTIDSTTTGQKALSISWSPGVGAYWIVGAAQVAGCSTRQTSGVDSTGVFTSTQGGSLGSIITGLTQGSAGAFPANWTTTIVETTSVIRVTLRGV